MSDNSAEEVKVIVRTVEFGSHEISLPRTANLEVLKQALERITGLEVSRQRLLHRGRELSDESASPESLGWHDGLVLHMVSRQAPPATRGGGTRTGRAQAAADPAGVPQQPGGQQQEVFDLSNLLPPDLAPAFAAFRDSLRRAGEGGIQGGMIGPIAVPIDGEEGFAQQMQEMLQDALRSNTVAPPIPGDLLNGRPPPLNNEGELEMGSSIDVLDRMLLRLENENMEEDQVPALQESDLENFRNPEYNRNWSVAIRSFLNAARVILQDCRLNRETREVVNRALRAAGLDPLPLGVRSFPVSHSASGSDDDDERPIIAERSGSRNGRQSSQRSERAPNQQRAAATEGEDHSWVQNISHEDLIIVAAVAIGELTRRFMGVLGDLQSPTGVNAMILRIAERLRSMSSVRNQQETIRQMRLIIGHLSRVAVSAAELSRGLAYLTSAIDQNNMFLLQLYPGYIQMQDGLPRPNLGILHNIEAHRVMTMIPDLPGMPSMEEVSPGATHGFMSMSIPIPVPMPGQPAPQAGQNDMPASGPVPMQTGNTPMPQTRSERPADGSGSYHPHPITVNIQQGVPNAGGNRQSGPQARAVLIGAQIRQPRPNAANPPPRPPGSTGDANNSRPSPPDLPTALRAVIDRFFRPPFSSSLGTTSESIENMLRDIISAVRVGLSDTTEYLRQRQELSIDALIQSALPQIALRVGEVLRRHASLLFNAGNSGTGTPNQPEEPQVDANTQPNQPAETPDEQPTSSPMEGVTATDMQQQSHQSEDQTDKRKVQESTQTVEDAKPGAAGPSQPPSGQKGPNPVGLGGGLKRRKVNSTSAKEKTDSAPKDTPTTRAGAQQSSQQQAPQGTNRSASRSSSSSGMQNMLNQVLQNPSMRNLLGGQDNNRSAPSLDLGSLLNTAGPMISQMLSGGPQQQQHQPGQQNVIDADGVIESEISDPQEQQRWKDAFNRVDHAATPQARREGFSEAYLSAIPARKEGGILESILGDE